MALLVRYLFYIYALLFGGEGRRRLGCPPGRYGKSWVAAGDAGRVKAFLLWSKIIHKQTHHFSFSLRLFVPSL